MKIPFGKFTARYIVPIAVLVGIAMFIIGVKFFVIKVGVDQVGVRTIIWGVKRGIVPQDYGPGWHRAIKSIDIWDLYDSTVQTLELAREPSYMGHDERKEVSIRTADDYDVSVDMIVKYQIKEGEAWQLRQDIGVGERYKVIVENETRDIARSVLGKMTEKDLYNPEEKRRRAEEMKEELIKRLDPRHVAIIDVLILEMRFDPQLERKIKNIKLAELDEKLNKAKALAAEQRGITQTIEAQTEAIAEKIAGDKERALTVLEAETEKKVIELIAEAEKYYVERKAEADDYLEKQEAAGTLLVDDAKAQGARLRREALAGFGGDIIVALEAARNTNLADINVSSLDLNLINMDEMADLFGVADGEGKVLHVDPKTFKQIQELLTQIKGKEAKQEKEKEEKGLHH